MATLVRYDTDWGQVHNALGASRIARRCQVTDRDSEARSWTVAGGLSIMVTEIQSVSCALARGVMLCDVRHMASAHPIRTPDI
jgi:hypothetical protein